jgi:hypothetical protein
MKISGAQMRLIHVLAKQLGMDSDQLHETVAGVTGGKESLKALSKAEANEVIDHLDKSGGQITRKKKPRRRKPSLPPDVLPMKSRAQMQQATHAQLQLIQALEAELGWSDDPRRLKGLVLKTLKKRRIATVWDAQAITQALKDMCRRKQRREAAGSGTQKVD